MKSVVNGQSSEAQEIIAGDPPPQCYFAGPTIFLLYNDDLAENFLRAVVNIYADDTTLNECSNTGCDE